MGNIFVHLPFSVSINFYSWIIWQIHYHNEGGCSRRGCGFRKFRYPHNGRNFLHRPPPRHVLLEKQIFAGSEFNSGQIGGCKLCFNELSHYYFPIALLSTQVQYYCTSYCQEHISASKSALVSNHIETPRSYSNIAKCNVGLHSSSAEF